MAKRATRPVNVRQRESMKTLLLAQGLQVEEVYGVMSAGDCGEDGDLALCRIANDLVEVVIKHGQVTEVFTNWSD